MLLDDNGLSIPLLHIQILRINRNAIFRAEPLAGGELLFCLAMSGIVFGAVEVGKLLVRRGRLYTRPPL